MLLACVFLWFGAAAPAPYDVGNDASVVMVADGTRADDPSRGGIEAADEAAPRSADAAQRESRRRATPRPREAIARRPVRDLYLRNCVLLC